MSEGRDLKARVLEIGNNRESGAYHELLDALKNESQDIRRLAASALGKLASSAGLGTLAVVPLIEAAKVELHPQARQYELKAIGQFAREIAHTPIAPIIADYLRDVSRDAAEKDYVRKTAAATLSSIQYFGREAYAKNHNQCTRCHRVISPDEARAGMEKYGQPYCRHCLDEKQLEDADFESEVNRAKKLRTTDGVSVQSQGERKIADWLSSHRIAYEYDERMRMVGMYRIRPDFYLPEFDVYIEYWGMDTPEYLENKRRKHILYRSSCKKLISLEPKDLPELDEVLTLKLSRYAKI